ncbi:hypothetical protein UFOVP58_128 [uncultured Caudovirales phage]|uniref:Uncharacterized protein n=1 Tax=uncultured Caudovirales phage TaxID=2100421 RepID=A0A6J5KSG4_9CAUD|nr:hypothetical protein UFOVP58_128 [uncultured Caudovirales phage]
MTQPYFYIIEHINTGKRYAGARWQKGCHPNEFMKESGYTTSSFIVNEIVKSEGLNSFKVLEILLMDNPYEFETEFLKTNNCAMSEIWLNKHNNENCPPPYGSVEFKDLMIEKYGVSHNSHIPEVREQMTKNQKEFYKNNPEFITRRSRKMVATKIINGTTGKGVKRPNYTNNGTTGNWERTEEYRKKKSMVEKIDGHFVKNNPMQDPEKRKLVSLSKIGKKKFVNLETNQTKMCFPDNVPLGFSLVKNK